MRQWKTSIATITLVVIVGALATPVSASETPDDGPQTCKEAAVSLAQKSDVSSQSGLNFSCSEQGVTVAGSGSPQNSIAEAASPPQAQGRVASNDEECAIDGGIKRQVVSDLHARMETCIFFGQANHPINGTWISYVKSTVDFYPYNTRSDSYISVTENDLSLGPVKYTGRTQPHLHHGILPPTNSGQASSWSLTTGLPDLGQRTVNQSFRWNHQIEPFGSIYSVKYYGSRIDVRDKLFNVAVAGSWSTPRFLCGEDPDEACRYPDGAEAPL